MLSQATVGNGSPTLLHYSSGAESFGRGVFHFEPPSRSITSSPRGRAATAAPRG